MNALAQSHQGHDHVLDHDQGQLVTLVQLAHHAECLRHFGGRKPGQDLVEQQQPWGGRKSACDFEPLASGKRQGGSRFGGLGREPDVRQNGLRLGLGCRPRALWRVPVQGRGDHIFQHRQSAKRPNDLKGAGYSEAIDGEGPLAIDPQALKPDLAAARAAVYRQ